MPAELALIACNRLKWALDAVGIAQTLELAVNSVSTSGTVVAVGLGKAGAQFSISLNPLVQQEKRIIGSLYGSSNPVVLIPKILDLYLAGRLPLERLIGETYSLADVNEAYQALSSGAPGRSIIVPSYNGESYRSDNDPRLPESSRAPLTTSLT